MTSALNQLLQRPDLWRARYTPEPSREDAISTGFPGLDGVLHSGGWPVDGLTELLCHAPCPQALRLLLPGLAAVRDGMVILAAPPARPHTRTLVRAGIDPQRLLILHSRDPQILMRACREAAASKTVATMVAWMPPGHDDPKTLRRLHLAARQGRCRLFLVRDAGQAKQPSPAPLRLLLTPVLPGDLEIRVHKQAGGRAGQLVRVPVLPEMLRTPPAAVAQMSAPQQHWRPVAVPDDSARPALLAPPGPQQHRLHERPG